MSASSSSSAFELASSLITAADSSGGKDWKTSSNSPASPDELEIEAREVGLVVKAVLGVEGLAAWLDPLAERWVDPSQRDVIIDSARAVESEPSLKGLSAHLSPAGSSGSVYRGPCRSGGRGGAPDLTRRDTGRLGPLPG